MKATQLTAKSALAALPELVAIVERLASIADGLAHGNSSAELTAALLADRAQKLIQEAA